MEKQIKYLKGNYFETVSQFVEVRKKSTTHGHSDKTQKNDEELKMLIMIMIKLINQRLK